MPIQQWLAGPRIALLDEAGDRGGVLEAAARLLAEPDLDDPTAASPAASPAQDSPGSGLSADAIAASLRQREQLASTAIGRGVAIPHGRLDGLAESRSAFLRLAEPVDFAAPDGQPVDLVFAMVVPSDCVQQHLEHLADVAERLGDAGFREALREAPDTEGLRRCLLGNGAPVVSPGTA